MKLYTKTNNNKTKYKTKQFLKLKFNYFNKTDTITNNLIMEFVKAWSCSCKCSLQLLGQTLLSKIYTL